MIKTEELVRISATEIDGHEESEYEAEVNSEERKYEDYQEKHEVYNDSKRTMKEN